MISVTGEARCGASILLQAARRASGLGQRELAERAQTSQSDVSFVERGKRVPTVSTFERLLDAAGYRLLAVKSAYPDAVESSGLIASALERRDPASAFRRFLDYSDGLSSSEGVDRVVLTAAEPHPTGVRRWDAAVAAVADFWLDESGLPKPGWLDDPARVLDEPESLQVSVYDPAPERDLVPEQFLRRRVLVERSTLASV